jgi:hypothetical protein
MFYPRLLVLLTYIVLVFYADMALSNGTTKVCRGVTLHVNSIQDSRCPKGAQCIWAGQADVQLRLSKKKASRTVNLMISAGSGTPQNSAQVTLKAASYRVTLQDVIPYPGTDSTPAKAVVQVQCP